MEKYLIGARELTVKLSKRAQKVLKDKNVVAVVGYKAPYSVYVHEDLHARHSTGQAKFLEQPARKLARFLHVRIFEHLKQGLTLSQALYTIGLKLQMESQDLVPIDTGRLHGSVFTRLERY